MRAFLALAEELNFTRAAERLHLAQQALSAQIRQLEERVGTPLVKRTTRTVALTPAGEAFRERARAAVAEAEGAVAAALEVAGGEAGTLRLGMSATAALDFMPAILRAWADERPRVRLELLSRPWTDLSAGVRSGDADLGLTRPPFAAEGLAFRTLWSEPRAAILWPGHPLADRDEVDPEELLHEPQIWVRDADAVQAAFWTLAELRTRPPTIGAEISASEDLFEIVRAGRAIGFVPLSLRRAAPDLRFPVVRGIPPTTVALCWREGDRNPLVADFADLAERVAGQSSA